MELPPAGRERERCPSRWINKLMAESAAAALSRCRHVTERYTIVDISAWRWGRSNETNHLPALLTSPVIIQFISATARDEIRSPRCRRNVDCTEMKRRAHAFSSFGSYSLIPRIQLDQKDEEFEKKPLKRRGHPSGSLSLKKKKKKKMATGRWLFPP